MSDALNELIDELIDELWDQLFPDKCEYNYENNEMTITHKDGTIEKFPIFVEVNNVL